MGYPLGWVNRVGGDIKTVAAHLVSVFADGFWRSSGWLIRRGSVHRCHEGAHLERAWVGEAARHDRLAVHSGGLRMVFDYAA